MSPQKKPAGPLLPRHHRVAVPRVGLTPLGAAALATLGWAGIVLLGLPQLGGHQGSGGLLWAAGVGALLGFTPLKRLLWVYAGLVMTLLLVIGFTPLIVGPVRSWIRRDVVALPPPDAVMVLSGGVSADTLLDPEATDRLLAALALARQWRRPLVISTEVERQGDEVVTSTADQHRLISLAGDSIVVFTVDSVHDTHDEAVAMAALAARHGWRSAAVVTAPMHSRRACAAFEHAGLLVACLPAESRDVNLSTLHGADTRLAAFGQWVYERLGWIEYRWRGWI
jgi:uncharacterized SAM-binding protein YcdF (DUF218 family)